jgi:hypothetical protein
MSSSSENNCSVALRLQHDQDVVRPVHARDRLTWCFPFPAQIIFKLTHCNRWKKRNTLVLGKVPLGKIRICLGLSMRSWGNKRSLKGLVLVIIWPIRSLQLSSSISEGEASTKRSGLARLVPRTAASCRSPSQVFRTLSSIALEIVFKRIVQQHREYLLRVTKTHYCLQPIVFSSSEGVQTRLDLLEQISRTV